MSEQTLDCVLVFEEISQVARSETFLREGEKKDPSLQDFFRDLDKFSTLGKVQFLNFFSGGSFDPTDVIKVLVSLSPKYILANSYRDDGSHSRLAYAEGKKAPYKKLLKSISGDYPEIGLILAIERYDAKSVNKYIDQGLDISKILPLKNCLVSDVYMYGYSAPLVEALVKGGAPLNVSRPSKVKEYGATAGGCPLHIAACEMNSKQHKIIQLMVEHGADVSLKDAEGSTVLHILCSDRHNPIQNSTVSKILEAGADLDCKDHDGMTPIMRLARNPENPKKLSILKLFEKLGANFNESHPEHGSLLDLSNEANTEIREQIETAKRGKHIFDDNEERRQQTIDKIVEELEQKLAALVKAEAFISSQINRSN